MPRMPAKIIDGISIASQIKSDVQKRVAELTASHHRVHLTAILVGGSPAGELYAQRQAESCQAVGIDYNLLKLPATATRRGRSGTPLCLCGSLSLERSVRRWKLQPGVGQVQAVHHLVVVVARRRIILS